MRQLILSFLMFFLIYIRFITTQRVVVHKWHATTSGTPEPNENGTHFIRRNTIANATTFKSLHKKAHHWAVDWNKFEYNYNIFLLK